MRNFSVLLVVTGLFFHAEALMAGPQTLAVDKCLTKAEVTGFINYGVPHAGQDWVNDVRNILCRYEISEPDYDGGTVVIVGNCVTKSLCYEECGTYDVTKEPLAVTIGAKQTVTIQDSWNNTWNLTGGLTWGNENSASSLILGAAKGTIEAGWEYGWAGTTATEVEVNSEETYTLQPCDSIRRYSFAAFRSGANGAATLSVWVTYDVQCKVHGNNWQNNESKTLVSATQSVQVTYVESNICGANLGSPDCNGMNVDWTGVAACPANNQEKMQLCGFDDI